MRDLFQEQLNELKRELTMMGSSCEEIIALASHALTDWDEELVRKVNAIGAQIDESERTIETICMKLLLRQQPVARDLRQISAAMKMITDMERIGDQAEDIVEIVPYMNTHPDEKFPRIREMAKAAQVMVTEAVDAYVKQDLNLARKVMKHDDVVDDYFTQVKKGILDIIAAEPSQGEYALDLLMIAKYFERIGDQAEDIVEIVPYMNAHPDEKYPKIREMARAAQTMVTEAVDAYVKQDLELARKVMAHDDVVDDYFTQVKSGIIDIIAAEPSQGEYALDLLMIAKYFERIGDHCTNIAEWVEFSVTGVHKDCQ